MSAVGSVARVAYTVAAVETLAGNFKGAAAASAVALAATVLDAALEESRRADITRKFGSEFAYIM